MNNLVETSFGNFENDEYLFFWKGKLSNWSQSLFEINYESPDTELININPLTDQWKQYFAPIIVFCCGEQAMMFEKARLFNDKDIALKILATNKPDQHKSLGRSVKNYDEKLWDSKRLEIVSDILYHRFTSPNNKDIRKLLLNSGDKILVEASPYDSVWGIKMDVTNPNILNQDKWHGMNLLGKALMNVRTKIWDDLE